MSATNKFLVNPQSKRVKPHYWVVSYSNVKWGVANRDNLIMIELLRGGSVTDRATPHFHGSKFPQKECELKS